ncbi:MAG: trigger factor [Candidatus Staskawiczbacteria bacterium]|nr:trigger factor [Candidatus Staskawiczbacteria bacterium]
MKTEIKKLQKSQMEVEFELTAEEFEKHLKHAVSHFKAKIQVDGFRLGQAPDKIIEEKIGSEKLLMEAGDIAVKEAYLNFVLENGLEPIGQPEINILKIAKGNPFLFKAKISVLPEIGLQDYKEAAKQVKNKEISVKEEEIEGALSYLRKSRAKFSQKNGEAEKGDFVEIEYQSKDIDNNKQIKDKFILGEGGFVNGFENSLAGMKNSEEKEFSVKFPDNYQRKDLAGKDISFKVKMISAKNMEMPEINDEFAKSLGAFENLSSLKKNIKEGITMEKQEEEKQRKRAEILDKIRQSVEEKSNFEIPEILLDYEKDRLLEDLKHKITQAAKITFEEYLQTVKQTEEAIRENFAKEAEKRLKNFLILREIGKKEKIEVLAEELEEELAKSLEYQKSEKFDTEHFKEYTKGAIYNEKVFQLLEKLSEI